MMVSKPVTRWIGRVQIVQAMFGHERGDFRADADIARRLVHDHQPAGLGDRGQNGLAVDRTQGRKIDDLGADALAVEFGDRTQRLDGHGAPGDDGDIAALAQNEAVVERQRLAVVAHFLAHRAIQPHRLEEHHRIGIADRGEQQAIGARRRGGADHANAGNVAQHGLGALRVVFGRVDAAAVRHANDHRAGQATAGAVAHARHVVDDLIERRIHESHELDFRHRLQAVRRHAHRHAGDGRFRQRRVLHALRAEARLQTRGGAKHAAVRAHVLTDHDDAGVVLHFPAMRHRDGFDHGYFRQFNGPGAWRRICAR